MKYNLAVAINEDSEKKRFTILIHHINLQELKCVIYDDELNRFSEPTSGEIDDEEILFENAVTFLENFFNIVNLVNTSEFRQNEIENQFDFFEDAE